MRAGFSLREFEIRRDIDYDGWDSRIPPYIGPWEATLTAAMPWGEAAVTAVVGGPDGQDRAIGHALLRLFHLHPGQTHETRVFDGTSWTTTRTDREGPIMANDRHVRMVDTETTPKAESTASPVDQVIAAIEAGTITTGDERRLRRALAEQDTQVASEALNKLGRALTGKKP